jgi:predicted DNA-binding ribbon-helix-helix protein
MQSAGTKRSIKLDGRKTSVSLEDAFWTELKEIAYSQRVTVSNVIASIEATRKQNNLSSAIRVFVLEHLLNNGRRTAIAPVSSDESQPTQV